MRHFQTVVVHRPHVGPKGTDLQIAALSMAHVHTNIHSA
jgi:hypothetical protein